MTDQEILRAALKAGLAWLFDTEQPVGANVDLGVGMRADDRMVRFVHVAGDGRDVPRGPAVILETVDRSTTGGGRPRVTLREGEMDEVAVLLAELGHPVVRTWNGKGPSGSLQMAGQAHPSALAALKARMSLPLRERGPGVPEVRPDTTELDALELARLRAAERAEEKVGAAAMRKLDAFLAEQGKVVLGDSGASEVLYTLLSDDFMEVQRRDTGFVSVADMDGEAPAYRVDANRYADVAMARFFPVLGDLVLRMAHGLNRPLPSW